MCKMKGHDMTIIIAISKTVVSFLVFSFVDNVDLVSGVKDAHTSEKTMIERFQELMTCWSSKICDTGDQHTNHWA